MWLSAACYLRYDTCGVLFIGVCIPMPQPRKGKFSEDSPSLNVRHGCTRKASLSRPEIEPYDIAVEGGLEPKPGANFAPLGNHV